MTRKFIGVFSLCILVSCGKSDGGKQPLRDFILNDPYLSNCLNDDPQSQSSYRNQVAIQGAQIVIRLNQYEDQNCSGNAIFTADTLLDWTEVGRDGSTPPIQKVDGKLQSMRYTARSEALVSMFNEYEFCGFKDWVLNQPKEMTGVKCSEDSDPIPKGLMFYSLAQQSDTTLYFGKNTDQLDGTTPEKRPIELDLDDPYKR